MYDMKTFQRELIQRLEEALKKKYGDAKIDVGRVKKVNRELTGLLCFVQERGYDFTPIIYLEDVYEKYREYEDHEMAFDEIEEQVINMVEGGGTFKDRILPWQRYYDKIFFHFMHTEQNRELLEALPHREFHDLSIVYRCQIFDDEFGSANALINHRMSEKLELDEEGLYQLAYENTRRMFPISIRPIDEVVNELAVLTGSEDSAESEQEIQKESFIYIISNEAGDKGAINILYRDEMQKLAERMGCDLYLIPSSMHEMLAIPAKSLNLNELTDMIYELNQTIVSPSDRLSNEVYRYNRGNQSVVQVTNTGYKLLTESPEEISSLVM